MGKCWCGLELEEERRCLNCGAPEGFGISHQGQHWVLRDPEDPNSGEPCGEIVTVLVCPEHGENCRVWRECEWARQSTKPGGDFRVCGLVKELLGTGWLVSPNVCATCVVAQAELIAALVEAVKAIGESVREAEAAEDAWVDAKALDHIGNIAQAVLDGLPKPEEVLEGEDLDDNDGQT